MLPNKGWHHESIVPVLGTVGFFDARITMLFCIRRLCYMMYPELTEVEKLLEDYSRVPVFYSFLADFQTPVGVFEALSCNQDECFLFESAENSRRWGRYSFIGINPRMKLTVGGGKTSFAKDGVILSESEGNIAGCIMELVNGRRSPCFKGLPRFTGGLVGYFGYDMLRYGEDVLGRPPADDLQMPDCVLSLYEEVVAFDHLSGKIFIIQNINNESDIKAQYETCEKHAKDISSAVLNSTVRRKCGKNAKKPVITSDITEKQFEKMVETAKMHIFDGDIFQAVLSRRFEVENPPDPFDVYRVLRAANPSPYLYFFKSPGYSIAGASPEMLIRVEDGNVTNRPIAGTSRRGKDEAEDAKLENELLHDEKERAEHTMLVDLGRNDVGRVCEFGTVKVDGFMHVERFSKVMHLVSEVNGRLKKGKTGVDALFSALPAGTLSGAPKIRAMQIIDSLEKHKRGVYGGAIGYVGFDGSVDTCIAIRTAVYRGDKAYVQAGAGIVADSVPEKEYAETANKAAAVLDAIKEAADL